MQKKVLIVIPDMGIGGAQKSLLSFLQCLSDSEDRKNYDIDLLVVKPGGEFYNQIPDNIRIITPHKLLRWLGCHFNINLLKECFSCKGIWGELCWVLRNRLKAFPQGLNIQQRLWYCWNKKIPKNNKQYDIAVSYMDGFPNYYVIEKINADKKVLWVHSEYQKQGYNAEYDREFYDKADAVITISEQCRQCVLSEFPECKNKVEILENITSYNNVSEKAEADISTLFDNIYKLKLLSVGRLNSQKGIDIAIDAAKHLKDFGTDFLWLVIGDGPERASLQSMIEEKQLNDSFVLVGASDNPYVYMKKCDILVQPSRIEGKSIVLDEAKILCKPIVVTNYTTVRDSIEHGENGWIVDMTGEAIAKGILELKNNIKLQEKFVDTLRVQAKGNEQELKKYLDIML